MRDESVAKSTKVLSREETSEELKQNKKTKTPEPSQVRNSKTTTILSYRDKEKGLGGGYLSEEVGLQQ